MKRSLFGAAALALTSSCSSFRSMFPTHEQVYTPVEASIGEMRVAGAETTYVVSAPGYELVAPTRDVLPRVQSALDLAAGRYRRYFQADPPAVVVELRPAAREPKGVRPESTWVRTDGGRAVSLTPLQPAGSRYDRGAGRVVVSVQPVAHLWLSALADATAGRRADSAGRVIAARTRDDPRIPDWIEDALIELIAPSVRQEVYAVQLARQPKELMPLRTLFEATRPPRPTQTRGDASEAAQQLGQPVRPPDEGDRAPGQRTSPPPLRTTPGRDAPRLGPSGRFAAQSLAVAQWIAEQEGAAFVGQLATRLIAGERAAVALAGESTVAADLDRLDAEWRAWLARQSGNRPET